MRLCQEESCLACTFFSDNIGTKLAWRTMIPACAMETSKMPDRGDLVAFGTDIEDRQC